MSNGFDDNLFIHYENGEYKLMQEFGTICLKHDKVEHFSDVIGVFDDYVDAEEAIELCISEPFDIGWRTYMTMFPDEFLSRDTFMF